MRRSLSSCLRPHRLGVSIATSVCAGALLAMPGISPVHAAPTVGGDENGPQVQILQPGYQDVLKGKSKILIAVKAQKFNPQFVEMFIDDKPATTGPISLDAQPSSAYNFDTKLFSDGPHKLTVRITDTQGFRGWAEVNIFVNNDKKVDTVPPSLSWKNISGYQLLSGKSQIKLDALDNFGVKWLVVSVNPINEPNRKPALRSWFLNRPPYVVNFDTTAVPDGLYKVTAKAWDSYEQEGAATTLTVGVDNGSTINATTIGDMLQNLRKIEESNGTAPKVKQSASTTFTHALPEDIEGGNTSVPKASAPNASVPSASVPNAYEQKPVAAKPLVPKTVAPRVAAPRVAKAPKSGTPLPAAPAATVPSTTVPSTTVPSTTVPSVAPPRLSEKGKANGALASTPGSLRNEIDGAMSDDWRNRLARTTVPAAELGGQGTFSAAPSADKTNRSLFASAGVAEVEGASSTSGRSAMPVGSEREFAAAPSQNPALELPALSSKNDRVLRVAQNAPLEIEADNSHTGVSSAPRIASRTVPAAPPSLSVTKVLPRTQVSAPGVTEVKKPVASKPAVAVKPDSPAKPRVAALPRWNKTDRSAAITAITVSPVEVKTSDAIPAFHTAARASDLRAVAARYGLPVEVVAACNDWPATKTLVAGEKVKLPQQLKVSYQGMPVKSDAPSMLVGGTSVTAFRFMFQQAGGKLEWDAKKQRVIAKKGGSEVVLTIGSNKAKVGDKDIMMELAAFLFEGRTMVPVRFFEEGLSAEVEWDPQTGRLVVAMAN